MIDYSPEGGEGGDAKAEAPKQRKNAFPSIKISPYKRTAFHQAKREDPPADAAAAPAADGAAAGPPKTPEVAAFGSYGFNTKFFNLKDNKVEKLSHSDNHPSILPKKIE